MPGKAITTDMKKNIKKEHEAQKRVCGREKRPQLRAWLQGKKNKGKP